MATDPSIILRAAQSVPQVDIFGALQEGQRIKDERMASQMRRAQLEDMTRKQHEQRVLNKVLQANIYTDPTTGAPSVSRKGVFSQLTDLGMGSQGLGLQHQWAQEDAAMAQAQAQAGKAGQEALIRDAEILDRASRAVSAGETPEARAQIWQTMIPQVKAAGVRIAGQLPDQYPGDSVFSQMKVQLGQFALPAKEGAEAAAKANEVKGFYPTDDGTAVGITQGGKAIQIKDEAGNPVRPRRSEPAVKVELGPKEQFNHAATLRKEYNDQIKPFVTVKDSYKRIEVAAENDSAASDINLIYAYMKMLDPGSVVREGEFATAQNAAGIPDRIRAAYNKAVNGERLAPATKADFIAQARNIYGKALEQQKITRTRYEDISKRFGLDVRDVVTDEGDAGGPLQGSKNYTPKKGWSLKPLSGNPDVASRGRNAKFPNAVWTKDGPDGPGWYERHGNQVGRVE